jgi:predicted dehydrogenase
MSHPPLRFGILGAARIAPRALIAPARVVPGAPVVAIAAREVAKARAFAQRHNIPRVLDSYDALVNDPDLDAIYNPLPNALHYEWTLKALRAGKHVLCEKPLASNAREAEAMARAADETGRVLMEAFHYRYHPLAQRVQGIIADGEIGAVRELEADFFIPLFLRPKDIRFDYALAGGATMDTGCYCINLLRWLGQGEPRVLRAHARLWSPQVDRLMRAELQFENGVTAKMNCSLAALPPLKIFARVRGEKGTLEVSNPFVPHMYFRGLSVTTPNGTRREAVSAEPTYNFQLRAFVAATRGENTNITDVQDALRNMRVIDAVYEKAGLKVRGT